MNVCQLSKSVSFFVIIIVCFGCSSFGAFISSELQWFTSVVRVNITNRTDKLIEKLTIEANSGPVQTNQSFDDVKPNQTIVFEALAPNVAFSYKVTATLENGRTIGPIGNYGFSDDNLVIRDLSH